LALAAKERDNRFCISCHLHEEKFSRLHAARPTDLAGFHQQKDGQVGCIACHGGADPVMRVRVWTVAGLDTVKFLVGAYGEPTHMRLALRDADCRQCHTPILRPRVPAASGSSTAAGAGAQGSGAPAAPGQDAEASYLAAEAQVAAQAGTSYHAIRDHDAVNVRCVRCHRSHTTDSDARNRFISKATVLPTCRECHKAM
jgi:predicted CXXCH cytochrome family protein